VGGGNTEIWKLNQVVYTITRVLSSWYTGIE
jgi:hypothetical protein